MLLVLFVVVSVVTICELNCGQLCTYPFLWCCDPVLMHRVGHKKRGTLLLSISSQIID